MNAEALIALGALVVNLSVIAVGYGVLKGTVAALAARISALEGEMGTLNDLKLKVTEIATRQDMWIEQLKELNASIRWMREPAGYEPPDGVIPPKGRR